MVYFSIIWFSSIIIISMNEVHGNLNDILEIFKANNIDEIPVYEVVEIRTKNLANGHKLMYLNVFGDEKLLKLKKVSQGNIPIVQALKNASGYDFPEIPHDETLAGSTYQDEVNHAALFIHPDEEGKLSVEGTIGHDLILKPLPLHLYPQFLNETNSANSMRHNYETQPNDEVFLNDFGQNIEDDINEATGKKIANGDPYHKHVVYKKPKHDGDRHVSDYLFINMEDFNNIRAEPFLKLKTPSTVYVDTLVYVDHITSRLFGNSEKKIMKYQQAFWNAVDLRFRTLKSPRVRINLVGVVIAKYAENAPFLYEHTTRNKMVIAENALDAMGAFLYRTKDRMKTKYDIALTITAMNLCGLDSNRGCKKDTTGMAYVAGACLSNTRREKMVNVGLVEDSGGYSGVMTAAHEVAHLLGAVHDGEPAPRYENLPGAERCNFEEGYIMSYKTTEKSYQWSRCSIESFQQFFKGDGATCMYDAPRKPKKAAWRPNKLMTLDEQCQKDRGTNACFRDERVCTLLFCYKQGSSGMCTGFRPAVDGSYCGKGRYCFDGKCTKNK